MAPLLQDESALNETDAAASPPLPQPPPTTTRSRRESSVRFSDDTNTKSKAPMSRRRQTNSDETEPLTETTQASNYGAGASQANASNSKPSSTPNPDTSEGDKEERLPWYKRLLDKFGSVTLENKSSVARDHLALERTFLAWLRTSLSFASIGVAVTQLFRLNVTYQAKTQQSGIVNSDAASQLPYSPLLGQTIPPELIPHLQQIFASAIASVSSSPTLGPTLLDQLLLLPPHPVQNQPTPQLTVGVTDLNDDAAARLRHVGKPLGATFLAISIVVLLIGFHRYFQSQFWLVRGKFPASRGSIFLISFITAAIIIASMVVVLVITPTSYKSSGLLQMMNSTNTTSVAIAA